MGAPLIAPAPRATRGAARRRAGMLLVVNPRATRADDADLEAVARILRTRFAVTIALTEGRGHATALAREAAGAGFDVVAAAGGDGTVSEAARGLAGSDAALACLPMGCTDVFARAIGTERRPTAAAQRLAERAARGMLQPRVVDLGIVDGRHFLYTAGVGFSADMTATADQAPAQKARLGQLHFATAAASELLGRYTGGQQPRIRVEADGRSVEGITVMAQNAHALTYFGPRAVRVCDAAGLQTGTISLTALRRGRPRDVLGVALRLVTGRDVITHPEVEAFGGLQEAVVTSADGRPLPLEADGEFLGRRQRIEFGVAPAALRVLA